MIGAEMNKSKAMFLSAVIVGITTITVRAEEIGQQIPQLGGLRLLPGYQWQPIEGAVDTMGVRIFKPGGLSILCGYAGMTGNAAAGVPQEELQWRKEQQVGDRQVMIAMRTDGLLIVSFVPQKGKVAANFRAKTTSAEEVADVLLMALTFPLARPATQPVQQGN